MKEELPRRYYTAREIAPMFGLSAETIKEYARAGQIPHVALGASKRKKLYFRLEEIEKAFAARSFTVNDILR